MQAPLRLLCRRRFRERVPSVLRLPIHRAHHPQWLCARSMARFQESACRSAESPEPGNALTFHKLGDHRLPGNRCVSIAHPYRPSSGNLVQDSAAWLRFEQGFGDWPKKIAAYREDRSKSAITIDYGTKAGPAGAKAST